MYLTIIIITSSPHMDEVNPISGELQFEDSEEKLNEDDDDLQITFIKETDAEEE